MKTITAITTGAVLLMAAAAQQLLAADAPVRIDETRQVSANERIEIEVMRGQVTIVTSNENIFRVSGVLDEQADGYLLHSENGFTDFRVTMPRSISRQGQGQESEFEIEVPVNSRVNYTGTNSDVSIEGVTGGTRVRTVNGEIVASGLSNFIELNTVNGRIESRNNNGRIEINTVNGEVSDIGSSGRAGYEAVNGDMDIRTSAEEVRVSVVNGTVRADLQGTNELRLQSVNGDMEVVLKDALSPRVSGDTVSGVIVLGFDSGVSARFTLQSHAGGRIINGISDDEVSRARFGPARSLMFSTGQGSGLVEMTSVSGRLEIKHN